MHVRLGEVLVERDVLTHEQVERALAEQRRTGQPFGLISERMFGISADEVEEAWAIQYASLTRLVDPRVEVFEDEALSLVSRRQAWQFRVLPIRFDDDDLMMATTSRHLRRALRFATKVIGVPSFFVMADALALGEALCRRFPLAGMTPQSVNDHALDRLLSMTPPTAA